MIEQISVFLENTHGRLSDALEVLSESDIDLRALALAETTNYGILRIIPDNPEIAAKKLKEHEFIVNETFVLAVEIEDRKGGMLEVVKLLSDEKIDIEYSYSCLAKKANKVIIILKVKETDKAKDILSKCSLVKLLKHEELI